VNKLASATSLTFCPRGLTIVFGRNGSGKSGYVRILRTACRTRVENPSTLKVLANVYGNGAIPQSADIVIDNGAGDATLHWVPGGNASPELRQVAVFDTASAELYVDSGHQIRYLPFGLALPHRLNTVCLTLRERLEAERRSAVGNKIALTAISFEKLRQTAAQGFDRGLKGSTTENAIDAAAAFDEHDEARLAEITSILTAGAKELIDLSLLIDWLDHLELECTAAADGLQDSGLEASSKLKEQATATREAAKLAGASLFTDDPLPGIGSETWRALWEAAREYSVAEAYPGSEFPVTNAEEGQAACVLCQQPLLADGRLRMERFRNYVEDKLGAEATAAEALVDAAISAMPRLNYLTANDFAGRVEQVQQRDADLAESLIEFQKSVVARRDNLHARLTGGTSGSTPPMLPIGVGIHELADKVRAEKDSLVGAADKEQRDKLLAEQAELADRKILAAHRQNLINRRDLLETDDAYSKALAEVQTKGITQRANELVDAHLTNAVVSRFKDEQQLLDIAHLQVGLSRKSGQTKAEFEIDPNTNLARVTSEILSEGEQRALALAGFLTEVALTEGSGPIILDDPVSSLDRDRSKRVAERLADEAVNRQVVVFTHDIVFFNELAGAAEQKGVDPVAVALFSDQIAAGKVDPAGMVWKGLNVAKRIGKLKNDFAPIAKLHATSPAEYEFQVKHLYGRLRDTYERAVEEVIFKDVVRRGVDVVQTQLLRYITLPDDLAIRFHEGMTLSNAHSHDNPASDTVPVRNPKEFNADIAALEKLIDDFKAAHAVAEASRPSMKPKK
jgi:energy-coupling factor transporter ATP-binding protein EcfA2